MSEQPSAARYAKGTNLSQLVPLLRGHRKRKPFGRLSASAERLLEERILDHLWYPFPPFVELLRVLDREILGGSEAGALALGIAGGKHILQRAHRAFVAEGDPVGSVLSMRHGWRAYFSFGELRALQESPTRVILTLSGYADVLPVHAGLIAGWWVAAAQLGGAPDAYGEWLERPWLSGERLVFRVQL